MRNHSGWGDNIQWMNWETRRVVGWTTLLPNKGDELIAAMESGRTARFTFSKVELCYNPSDMWFATLKDKNYED